MITLATGLDEREECIDEAGNTPTLHPSQLMVLNSAAARSGL
jgi:hypothetical protein